MKSWILLSLVSVAGAASLQAPTLTIKVAGTESEVLGRVVDGKDMVPLADISQALGAQLEIQKRTPTDRVATITMPTPAKSVFQDNADTIIPVDGDTSVWLLVANSDSKIRVRDFVRPKDKWDMQGEIDIERNSIMVQGRPPRDNVVLNLYAVFKDKDGKTIGRKNIVVNDVSPEGGRYPITINLYRNDGSNVLPVTVGLRFNAAADMLRGE